ncbi:caspase b-like [Pieris brassicae]|uniref:caspase b-like n=1 Tax=Pieris brassicae TaxID=7116 RepID=UPI001E65FEF5|nr:caspase b-like [Pieris brassicae]
MSTPTKITFTAGRKMCECPMCALKRELGGYDRSTTDGRVYNLPEYEANVTPSAIQKPNQNVIIVSKSNLKPSDNTKVTPQANTQSPNSSNTVNTPKIPESKVPESKTVLPTNLPLENQKPNDVTKVTSEANPQSPNSTSTVNSSKISESKAPESKTVLPTNLPLENQKPNDVTKVTSEANPQSPNSSNTVNSRKIPESKVPESTNVLPTAVNQIEQQTNVKSELRPSTVNSATTESKNEILQSRTFSQLKTINSQEDRTNTRPLNRHAKTYELENFEKKLLIIINQYEIIGYKEPRWGTENDVIALTHTFTKFGFDIELHEDETVSEVSTLLGTFDDRNFSEYGCVAIVVLTHGIKGGYLHAKDGLYHEYVLLNAFKTQDRPSLVTKPKLLIIQACRGEQSVEGVNVGTPSTTKRDAACFEPYLLPCESDIYVLHSSYEGKPSHRDILDGSWLIQTLCKKINELAPTHDLASIVTEVKQEVAIDLCFEEYNTETLEVETNTQVPVDTSTLIRKLYFRKYGDAPISGIPTTPDMKVEKCSCFKDYFTYIRACLRLHLKQNPGDAITEYFITASESLESRSDTSDKEKITKAIVNYLSLNSKQSLFYKSIHFKN